MIYLVRHGEAEHNVNATRIAGRANSSPLTDLGISQSERVGEELKSKKIKYIYHSPAIRCVDTARIIGRQFPDIKLIADERLLEMDQGELVGTPKLLVVINPVTFFKLLFKGKNFSFKNGESFNQVADRMEDFLKDAKPGTLVVTHGMAIRALLARRKNWSVWKIIFRNVKNTEVIKI